MKMKTHRIAAAVAAMVLVLSGCSDFNEDKAQAGEIPFKLTGIKSASCPMQLNVQKEAWQLDYFGFYLSNPEVRINGRWQAVKFKPNNWQTDNIALLRFHALCDDKANANDKIALDVTDKFMKRATNLRFTLGVPFAQNHERPTDTSSPLGDSEMFTNEQSGHKFLRLDLSQPNSEQKWQYHLGSVGCESASLTSSPYKACAFTNRVEFILPMTQLDTDLALELSVSNIVSQVDLMNTDGCTTQTPEQQPCKKLLNNLLQRPWLQWD